MANVNLRPKQVAYHEQSERLYTVTNQDAAHNCGNKPVPD